MGQRMLGVVGACALAMFVAVPAASAAHNSVQKADKSQRSMVAAYQPCNNINVPNPEVPSINDPATGELACVAHPFNTTLKFGPKGMSTLKVTRVAAGKPIKDKAGTNYIPGAPEVPPYPFDREANASGDIVYSLTGSDIRFADDSPAAGITEELRQTFRLTDEGCAGSSCTVNDTVLFGRVWGGSTPATTCAAGKCQFTSSLNIMVREIDPHPIFGVAFSGTATANAVGAGKNGNLEESAICATPAGGLDYVCQGLLIGKADSSPEPAGFVRPMKANTMQLALVRDFDMPACVPITHDDPWRSAPCAPVEGSSELDFGAKGSGQVKLGPSKSATHNEVKVTATVKDVRLGADNDVKFDGPVSVRFPVTVTHGECAGSTLCTRPTQTAAVDGTCKKGTCKIVGVTDIKLPQSGFSSVQIGSRATAGGPNNICVYDGPAAELSAKPLACPGSRIP